MYKKITIFISIIILLLLWFTLGYIKAGLEFIPPHYHANFAVFVEGKQLDFSKDEYMEDVAACKLSNNVLPNERVHLHENDGDSVHIHAAGVAWNHFFENIGFVFEDTFLYSEKDWLKTFTAPEKAHFVLNGEIIKNPNNSLIHSEDSLLIYYGSISDEEVIKLFKTLPKDASEYNTKYDPASCGGTNEKCDTPTCKEYFRIFRWA